jgi:flagellum-specific peptidoglycan hydrolase FlgJ
MYKMVLALLMVGTTCVAQVFIPYASVDVRGAPEEEIINSKFAETVEYDFTVDGEGVVSQKFIRYRYESLTSVDAHRFTVGAAMAAYNLIYTKYPQTKMPSEIDNFLLNHGMYAVEVMNETGIPASIILAQANIESRAGLTTAAKKKHIIFNVWVGRGKLAKFRKRAAKAIGIPIGIQHDEGENREFYGGNTLRQHYTEIYGDYITGKGIFKGGNRYKPCFEFGYGDYKSWACCLQWKGYATDPTYYKQLIGCIEKYHFDMYDQYFWNNMQVLNRFSCIYDVPTADLLFPAPISKESGKRLHTGKINSTMNEWFVKRGQPKTNKQFLNLKKKLNFGRTKK